MFQQLRNKELASPPTPAVLLHQKYCRIAAKHHSSISDWQNVLRTGITLEQAEAIIRWLQRGGLPDLPHARTIAKNAKWYAELAAKDPLATVTAVSVEAFEMAIRIADAGFEIEAEYVQNALDQYKAFLGKPLDDLLYHYLPPARIFVESWFTELMPRGTPRMRRFHLEHTKFKEFIRLTLRAAKRG